MAWVRFPDSTSSGLSMLLVLVLALRIFLRVLRFSPLLKNRHYQIPTGLLSSTFSWASGLVDCAGTTSVIDILNKLLYLLLILPEICKGLILWEKLKEGLHESNNCQRELKVRLTCRAEVKILMPTLRCLRI